MRISFFGHFGTLNSGNESTFLAMLSYLRIAFPDGDFCCICNNPETIVALHGIQAIAISSRVIGIRNGESRFARRLKLALIGLWEELGQYVRAFRTLKRTDMLIIPGTGLVTDAYGLSAWGPYNLFKWTLMARVRRCKVLFVSVGAGPIDTTFGRLLVRSALSLATYRSYRDETTKTCLKDIGVRVKRDRVYPDLAFSLPEALLPATRETGGRRVVGLGLMLYAGKYSVVNPTDKTYTTYLGALVSFAEWLLAHDYDIRLLLGDSDDVLVIEEFKALLQARVGTCDEARVIHQPIDSVQATLSQLAATDVVVATRFHNVLLALLLDKPVIAISFHNKCDSLMSGMRLSKYIHDINRMDAGRLIGQFQELELNKTDVELHIRERVEECRSELAEQYALLFESARAAGPAYPVPVERAPVGEPTSDQGAYQGELVS